MGETPAPMPSVPVAAVATATAPRPLEQRGITQYLAPVADPPGPSSDPSLEPTLAKKKRSFNPKAPKAPKGSKASKEPKAPKEPKGGVVKAKKRKAPPKGRVAGEWGCSRCHWKGDKDCGSGRCRVKNRDAKGNPLVLPVAEEEEVEEEVAGQRKDQSAAADARESEGDRRGEGEREATVEATMAARVAARVAVTEAATVTGDATTSGEVAPYVDADADSDEMDEATAEHLHELVWQQRLDCFKRLPFLEYIYFRAAAKCAGFRHLSFNDTLLGIDREQERPLTSGYEKVKAFVSKMEPCEELQTFASDLFYVVLTTDTKQFLTMQEFLDYADPNRTPWENFYAHMCVTVFVCKNLKDAESRHQKNAYTFLQKWHSVVKNVIKAVAAANKRIVTRA